MNLNIKIDPLCTETEVVIRTREMTDELQDMIRLLSGEKSFYVLGFKNSTVLILEPLKIVRIYSDSGKIYAKTDSDQYILRARLYELEEQLDSKVFVRISNSEIINLKKVRGFDFSFSGTICVHLNNGETTYVSRRYVSKIKQVLGM